MVAKEFKSQYWQNVVVAVLLGVFTDFMFDKHTAFLLTIIVFAYLELIDKLHYLMRTKR